MSAASWIRRIRFWNVPAAPGDQHITDRPGLLSFRIAIIMGS